RRGNAEARVVGRDADVAGDGDADAPAHAVAVNHGEEGLCEAGDGIAGPRPDLPVLLFVRHVAPALLHPRVAPARHESFVPGAAHDDPPDGVVGGEVVDVLRHELPRLDAHGIPLLGLVEDDPADRSVLLQQEGQRFAHGRSPEGVVDAATLYVSGPRYATVTPPWPAKTSRTTCARIGQSGTRGARTTRRGASGTGPTPSGPGESGACRKVSSTRSPTWRAGMSSSSVVGPPTGRPGSRGEGLAWWVSTTRRSSSRRRGRSSESTGSSFRSSTE